jgi:hypothetical protein
VLPVREFPEELRAVVLGPVFGIGTDGVQDVAEVERVPKVLGLVFGIRANVLAEKNLAAKQIDFVQQLVLGTQENLSKAAQPLVVLFGSRV